MAKKYKEPRVRIAKAGDRNLFRKLWMAFLEEAYNGKDAEIKPTEHNLDRYSALFDAYVGKELPGVVLFVGEAAVLMWGTTPMPFESDTQQRAIGWGVYVKPSFKDKDYVKLIKTEAIQLLKSMNCDEVILDVKSGGGDKAELLEGASIYSTLYRIDLNERHSN